MKNKRVFALLLACLMLLGILTGCAAKSAYDMAASTAAAMPEEAMAEEYYYNEYAEAEEAVIEEPMSTYASEEVAGGAFEEGSEEPVNAADTFASKIIYSASLSVQTTEFDNAVSALEAMVSKFGGFVESSNINGSTCYEDDGSVRIVNRWGYYTVRIPADRFEEFLHQSNGLGNVISSGRDATNVTSQYTDYEAHLESLQTQEERLLEMLKQAEDIDSLIALEQRLSDVRYEIESIQRNLRNLDQQISYSTVNIELQEVEKYTPVAYVQRTFGEKLRDSISNGWTRFVTGLGNFAIDLVGALPALILFAVIVAAVVIFVRRGIKKRKAKKAAKAAAKAQEQEEQN